MDHCAVIIIITILLVATGCCSEPLTTMLEASTGCRLKHVDLPSRTLCLFIYSFYIFSSVYQQQRTFFRLSVSLLLSHMVKYGYIYILEEGENKLAATLFFPIHNLVRSIFYISIPCIGSYGVCGNCNQRLTLIKHTHRQLLLLV